MCLRTGRGLQGDAGAGGLLQGERGHPAHHLQGAGLLCVRRRGRAVRVGRLPRQAVMGCVCRDPGALQHRHHPRQRLRPRGRGLRTSQRIRSQVGALSFSYFTHSVQAARQPLLPLWRSPCLSCLAVSLGLNSVCMLRPVCMLRVVLIEASCSPTGLCVYRKVDEGVACAGRTF